jgi:hypothetical protein
MCCQAGRESGRLAMCRGHFGPGGALPESRGVFVLAIPAEELPPDVVLDERFYWFRYQNTFGNTWETRNPWRPEEQLNIRLISRCLALMGGRATLPLGE